MLRSLLNHKETSNNIFAYIFTSTFFTVIKFYRIISVEKKPELTSSLGLGASTDSFFMFDH